MAIPKIIHYCWFGGKPLPEMAEKCIASWEKYCPDYEIVRWDESNFDLDYCPYVHEAFEAKKWAFITDVVRLYVLVNYGGIYMDTDVEVVKPLSDLLGFEALSGFESETQIPTGLMASEKNQPLFCELLHEYDDAHFLNPDGSFDLTTNVTRITNTCLKYGFVPNNKQQTVKGFTLLPKDYLCPKDAGTRQLNMTENTYTIHHFDGSWLSPEEQYRKKLYIANLEKHGKVTAWRLATISAAFKFRGIGGVISVFINKLFNKKAKTCDDERQR